MRDAEAQREGSRVGAACAILEANIEILRPSWRMAEERRRSSMKPAQMRRFSRDGPAH
jgi:hypothetical protein